MTTTANPRLAMERLADFLDWQIASSGSAWTIQEPKHFEGLHYSSLSLLCLMARVAHYDHAMSAADIRSVTGFRPRHYLDRERWELSLPPKVSGTDEVTVYQFFFDPPRELAS